MSDPVTQFADIIRAAADAKRPLNICGSGSKVFYGNPATGEALDVTAYRGIIEYEPTELVISARAGTPLAEIEAAMREQGQMLGFEPPHFGGNATLGGCIAAGLSGPRRPYAGSARDFVLGVRILDGRFYVRLAGATPAVHSAAAKLGGETVTDGAAFWQGIRDQRHAFFTGDAPLWRLSLLSTKPELALSGTQLIEWGGALRWLRSDEDTMSIRKAARSGDGHATRFRGVQTQDGEVRSGAFHSLPSAMLKLHKLIKLAMDPAGILNPGRMYPEL